MRYARKRIGFDHQFLFSAVMPGELSLAARNAVRMYRYQPGELCANLCRCSVLVVRIAKGKLQQMCAGFSPALDVMQAD